MHRKIVVSQIVRKKLNILRKELQEKFGMEVSKKSVKRITDSIRSLERFPEKGVSVTAVYKIECDYRCLFVHHNYLFYRVETDKIIIVEIFDEREDFMAKMFGVETTSGDENSYWED